MDAEELLKGAGMSAERSYRFAAYWLSLPRTGLIPRRDAFLPEDVPGLLPNISIHELVGPDCLLIRLVGSAVVRDYGRDLRGRNYLDHVDQTRRASAARSIHLICEQPAGMAVRMRARTRSGRVILRESIALPMGGRDGAARFVYFCSTNSNETAGVSPRDDELIVLDVLQRVYLDIGAGVPDFSE